MQYQRFGHIDGFFRSHSTSLSCVKRSKSFPHKNIHTAFKVSSVHLSGKRKYSEILIYSISVRLQIDTGSNITLIYRNTGRTLGSPPISRARNASGDLIKLVGEVECDSRPNLKIFEVNVTSQIVMIQIDQMEQLSLWDIPPILICSQIYLSTQTSTLTVVNYLTNHLKSKYSSVFSEILGYCTVEKEVLCLWPNVQPVSNRNVQFHIPPYLWQIICKIFTLVSSNSRCLKGQWILTFVC